MANTKAVGAQTKNNTKAEINEKKLREEVTYVGRDQLESVPEWLVGKAAKAEWKRLVKEFNKKSLLSNLDYNNLGLYCNAYARYRMISDSLTLQGVMIGKNHNPLVALELKYSDELKKYSNLLGLSSESRLNIGSNILTQENKEIENEFGV